MDIKKSKEDEQWDEEAPLANQKMEMRRLTFFVAFMSIFVLVLFGLAPSI